MQSQYLSRYSAEVFAFLLAEPADFLIDKSKGIDLLNSSVDLLMILCPGANSEITKHLAPSTSK